MSNPRGAPAQIQLAASRNPFQLWMGAAKICLFPKSRPKKRGRAGKRKSPSGVFYTAVFGKKEAGNGETPPSPDFTPGFLRAAQNYIFFIHRHHSSKEFFQTGPKTVRYKDFLPKVDKLHIPYSESLRELPKKNNLKIRGPGPGAESVDEGFYRPKSQKRRFPASWHPFKGEFSSPRPEIQNLREFLGEDDKLHDFRKKSAQRG